MSNSRVVLAKSHHSRFEKTTLIKRFPTSSLADIFGWFPLPNVNRRVGD